MKYQKIWTKDEINILENNQDKTISQLIKLLPNRSYRSIYYKINKEGYKFNTTIRNKTQQKEYAINMSKRVHYKKKGIILDPDKGCNTYNIIEWYNFIIEGKIKEFPQQVINKESTIILFKHVIENILGIKSREEIKNLTVNDFHKNKLYFKTFNMPTELYKVINFIYPEYDIKPWEIKMTGINVFRNEDNIFLAMRWFFEQTGFTKEQILNINQFIDCSVEELFSKYGLSCLITKSYFNGYQNLFIWYFNKIGDTLTFHDFAKKTNGYWKIKSNADYQMELYLKYLFENNLIINIKLDLPRYFSYGYLYQSDFKMLCVCIKKHKHYNNFYEWLNTLHPEYQIQESDFNVFIGCDGVTKCLSFEEKGVFDYIYRYLNIKTIKSFGLKRDKMFFNYDYNEQYVPDFKIENINNDLLLDKPLVIEYYGLYSPKNKSKKIQIYVNKTNRKNNFYKNNNLFYFIDLYPEDLKNNYEGVRNKITQFFIKNFNYFLIK